MMKAFVVIGVSVLLSGCYTTQQSIGTSTMRQSYSACMAQNNTSFKCLRNSPNFASFTQAEKEMIAFMLVIEEKYTRGEITKAEAEYVMAQYMNRATAIGAASERAQAAEMSAALNNLSQNLNAAAAAQAAARPPAPAMSTPMPVQTRCWRNGMYVNCTTY
jgi:hypothetical protein